MYVAYAVDDAAEVSRLGGIIQSSGWDICYGRAGLPAALDTYAHSELLGRASCILVIWSANAVSAAGVRQDTLYGIGVGRLVLVSLDAAAPPVAGVEAVSLEGWLETGNPRGMTEIVKQIERFAGRGANRPGTVIPYEAVSATERRARPQPSMIALAAAFVVAVAGIAWSLSSTLVSAMIAGNPAANDQITELAATSGPEPGAGQSRPPPGIRRFTTPSDEPREGNPVKPIDWLEQAAWRDVERHEDVPAQLDAIANFLIDFPTGAFFEEAQLLEVKQREALRYIQSELIAKGFLSDLETSSIARTRMAAEKFERSLGLEPTGLISSGLLVALEAGKLDDDRAAIP